MNIVCQNQVYIEAEKGWYIDEVFNQIFQIDLSTNKVKYIDSYGGTRYKKNSQRLVKKYGNELYIFPFFSRENIIVYDLEKKGYEEIALSNFSNMYYAMVEAWETLNDNIIIYCWRSHKILELNKINKKLTKCVELKNDSVKFGKIRNDINSAHILFLDMDKLIEIDFASGSITSHQIKDICGIIYTEKFLWVNKKNEIIIYDNSEHKVVDSIIISDDLLGKQENLGNMDARVSENYIWCVPLYSNEFVYINRVNKEINVLTVKEEQKSEIKIPKYKILFTWKNRYLYLYSRDRNANFMIDMETAEYRDIDFDMIEDNYQDMLGNRGLQRGDYHVEDETINIKNIIVMNRFDNNAKDIHNKENVGNKIYYVL